MVRFFQIAFFLTAAFVALIALALQIGRARPLPAHVALLHLDMCAPPCWIGITPGITSWEEIDQRINQVFQLPRYKVTNNQFGIGYIIQDVENSDLTFTVQFSNERAPMRSMTILSSVVFNDGTTKSNSTVITFGDLNAVWGSPHSVAVWPCYGDWLPYYGAHLNSQIVVNGSGNRSTPGDSAARAGWNNPVALIQFYTGDRKVDEIAGMNRWRGFLSYEQYGQGNYRAAC